MSGWETSTWNFRCNHLHPPQASETLPYTAVRGYSAETEYFPATDVSTISFFSWWETGGVSEARRLWAKHSSGAPARAGEEDPLCAIGMEPCHGWTISSVSVTGGWGVFEILVLFQVCFQLPVSNSSSNSSTGFAAPAFCGCSISKSTARKG